MFIECSPNHERALMKAIVLHLILEWIVNVWRSWIRMAASRYAKTGWYTSSRWLQMSERQISIIIDTDLAVTCVLLIISCNTPITLDTTNKQFGRHCHCHCHWQPVNVFVIGGFDFASVISSHILSMLGLKLIRVNKRGPWENFAHINVTHLPLVSHISVSELDHLWFR